MCETKSAPRKALNNHFVMRPVCQCSDPGQNNEGYILRVHMNVSRQATSSS